MTCVPLHVIYIVIEDWFGNILAQDGETLLTHVREEKNHYFAGFIF